MVEHPPAEPPSAFARRHLAEKANPARAVDMAAYMKTSMPFYGVMKPQRSPILRELVRTFPPADHRRYVSVVAELWSGTHREEKYLALGYARAFPEYVDTRSMDLYERLIVDGAWWDFVDDIAANLVGRVLMDQRTAVTSTMRRWIGESDMWLRRSSIICQLRHRDATDVDLLADACLGNMGDGEFFIRKAIGWALREHAKVDPDWVRTFVDMHRAHMAALSVREALKHL